MIAYARVGIEWPKDINCRVARFGTARHAGRVIGLSVRVGDFAHVFILDWVDAQVRITAARNARALRRELGGR